MTANIQDYLQTQGLRLDADTVRMAEIAAAAVMQAACAAVESQILWYERDGVVLSDHLPRDTAHEQLLKQSFLALDAACSRMQPQSAAVYLYQPEQSHLLLLSQYGTTAPALLPDHDEVAAEYLAVRTARSGWLNLAEDSHRWLEQEMLLGEHNRRHRTQISLPVCGEDGRVFGVVCAAYDAPAALDTEAQAQWVGLTLALLPVLQAFSEPAADN